MVHTLTLISRRNWLTAWLEPPYHNAERAEDIFMQLTVLAKRAFPGFKTRLAIRRAVFFPLDVLDVMSGKRDPLVPPRGLWFVGGGHFHENQFLDSFVRLCDLQPCHRVLDVGCGI